MKNLSTRRTTSKKSKTKAKTNTRKGSTAKKTSASSERSTLQNTRRQLWSLIMFGAALILGVLTFLPGENIWLFLHKGYFGLFGITTYLVAPLVLVISILLAFEKTALNVTAKIVQALSIVFLTSGAFHIFFGVDPVGSNFFYKIINLFELGVQRKGGGLAGALIGWSLSSLFGNIAAGIVIVIVIIIFLFICVCFESSKLQFSK